MEKNKLGIVVYEANGNIYLNIANKCTAECIFCTKRYFAKRYFEYLNCSKIDNSKYTKHPGKEEILKVLESYGLSEYNDTVFTGNGEPLPYLDNVIYGNIRSTKEPIYGINLHLSKEPNLEEILIELEDYDISKYNEAVFTGMGEPLTRIDTILEITKWLTDKGIAVRVNTIGHANLLYPKRRVTKELSYSGMKKVSISLNAHDEETYNQLCKPKFKNAFSEMLKFAHEITKTNMKLRFTILNLSIIDIEKCRKMARQYDADFMVRTFF